MTTKKIVTDGIALLFIMLWAYAAFSKLLDFENFRVQLRKSPLISGYAGLVAILVPSIELIIAALLLFENTKRWGLGASLSLMMVFTVYLIAILNFSYYIPCSCGGIIGKSLGWKAHTAFNLFFILLAAIGLIAPISRTSSFSSAKIATQ